VFADLQLFPNIGAFHGSEGKSSISCHSSRCPGFLMTVYLRQPSCVYHVIVPILFGTYNRSTATAAEVELSKSLQTAFANFAKDPTNSPAPNWPAYEPGILGIAPVPTLAEIAYQGNVGFDDFIQPVQPISKVSKRNFYSKLTCSLLNIPFLSKDGPCILWDALLDFRP
jgi:hypothetical protein